MYVKFKLFSLFHCKNFELNFYNLSHLSYGELISILETCVTIFRKISQKWSLFFFSVPMCFLMVVLFLNILNFWKMSLKNPWELKMVVSSFFINASFVSPDFLCEVRKLKSDGAILVKWTENNVFPSVQNYTQFFVCLFGFGFSSCGFCLCFGFAFLWRCLFFFLFCFSSWIYVCFFISAMFPLIFYLLYFLFFIFCLILCLVLVLIWYFVGYKTIFDKFTSRIQEV